MVNITSDLIVIPDLEKGAIYHWYEDFHLDYLVLHCLIKIYKPQRFLEIGCNEGVGTKIIKNAIGDGEVFSLDLPDELIHLSMQHPKNEGKKEPVGWKCHLPFTLLLGDSLKFNYAALYPIDGWYIDGEHDWEHPYHEAKEAIKSNANIIIFHDSNIDCVYKAITDAFAGNEYYTLFRITDTRVAYAHKKIQHESRDSNNNV